METTALEKRVAALEAEVERLKQGFRSDAAPERGAKPWWEESRGTFKYDPIYQEAMRLGEEYRRSQPTPADEDDVPS